MPNTTHFFVDLAKTAVESYIKKGEVISPFTPLEASLLTGFNDLPSRLIRCGGLPKNALIQKAGTFVTIMENGNLRGCIGTYLPTKNNIAEEIINNAIAAATEDHRFRTIREQDLSQLSYTVYILDTPEQVNNLKELDPKKYGIIVKNAPTDGDFVPMSGLLLPDLKGIDTIEKQITIACQKAGIDPVQEKISIYKFTAKKYQ